MERNGSHSHPFDNDLIPSASDRNLMKQLKKITGQTTSEIVTPNGKRAKFDENGIIEIKNVSNRIDKDYERALLELFGGKVDD